MARVTHPVDDTIRVLFVQDDPAVAEMYKLKLELDGYQVTIVSGRQQRGLGPLGIRLTSGGPLPLVGVHRAVGRAQQGDRRRPVERKGCRPDRYGDRT